MKKHTTATPKKAVLSTAIAAQIPAELGRPRWSGDRGDDASTERCPKRKRQARADAGVCRDAGLGMSISLPRVSIRIDRLVLRGFSTDQRMAIAGQLRSELAHLPANLHIAARVMQAAIRKHAALQSPCAWHRRRTAPSVYKRQLPSFGGLRQ